MIFYIFSKHLVCIHEHCFLQTMFCLLPTVVLVKCAYSESQSMLHKFTSYEAFHCIAKFTTITFVDTVIPVLYSPNLSSHQVYVAMFLFTNIFQQKIPTRRDWLWLLQSRFLLFFHTEDAIWATVSAPKTIYFIFTTFKKWSKQNHWQCTMGEFTLLH